LLLLIFLVLGLGLGGVWWRSPLPVWNTAGGLTLVPLDVSPRSLGPVRFLRGWHLQSFDSRFGGYSALIRLGDGRFLAGSDRGYSLTFPQPGTKACCSDIRQLAQTNDWDKRQSDMESLTRDPGTGRVWAGYEYTNEIVRYESDLKSSTFVAPPQMHHWAENGGPEAIAHLSDGRFIVLAEVDPGWAESSSPGLLFPGDPLEGGEPVAFRFRRPDGFRAVDMAQLPDGRVLILLRKVVWGIPPGFRSRVIVADPAQIAPGGMWSGKTLFDIGDPLPTENFEGLAIDPQENGHVHLWLISDDNTAKYQRTLLFEFDWDPRKKARGQGRTPD